MTMLIMIEPILEKIQKHFKDYGITSSIPRQRLDFESDYLNTVFLGTKDGISSAGSLKLENSSINYVSSIKNKNTLDVIMFWAVMLEWEFINMHGGR